MSTALVNDIEIYYERHGSGPRLLFINGSGATLAGGGPFLDVFAAHFDVLAYDQRGLGKTSIPAGPCTMADYGNDAAALAEAVGWDTYRVVGISFGGMVAQELAVTFPDRIERLALMCTSAGGQGGASYPLHALVDMAPDERAAVSASILDTRFTPEWLAAHPTDAVMAGLMASRHTVEKSAEVLRGEALQLEARRYHDVFDRLPRITCPTVVACGLTDGIAPLANGQAIASQIAHSEMRTYNGGHIFFFQDPQAFPETIEFLAL